VTSPDSLVPIRFYREFWTRDFQALPAAVQTVLGDFLLELQKNPIATSMGPECHRDPNRKDRFAHFFGNSFAVYWQLIRQPPDPYIQLDSEKVILIFVLALR
jgi:hypothetical protein